MTAYKRKMEHYFNIRVKPRSFKEEELMLKVTRTKMPAEGKRGPWWERP